MLQLFGSARTVAELERLIPAALLKAREQIDLLRSGNADPLDLVIRRHISREAEEYANRSANALVAQALEEAGVHLEPGEMIEYILVDATGKRNPAKAKPVALYAHDDGYDIDKYMAMALDAMGTLLLPFGYNEERCDRRLIFRSGENARSGRIENRFARHPCSIDSHAGTLYVNGHPESTRNPSGLRLSSRRFRLVLSFHYTLEVCMTLSARCCFLLCGFCLLAAPLVAQTTDKEKAPQAQQAPTRKR